MEIGSGFHSLSQLQPAFPQPHNPSTPCSVFQGTGSLCVRLVSPLHTVPKTRQYGVKTTTRISATVRHSHRTSNPEGLRPQNGSILPTAGWLFRIFDIQLSMTVASSFSSRHPIHYRLIGKIRKIKNRLPFGCGFHSFLSCLLLALILIEQDRKE